MAIYHSQLFSGFVQTLNLTLVLENSWNLKNGSFVLEFCTNALDNMGLSWENIKKKILSICTQKNEWEMLDM